MALARPRTLLLGIAVLALGVAVAVLLRDPTPGAPPLGQGSPSLEPAVDEDPTALREGPAPIDATRAVPLDDPVPAAEGSSRSPDADPDSEVWLGLATDLFDRPLEGVRVRCVDLEARKRAMVRVGIGRNEPLTQEERDAFLRPQEVESDAEGRFHLVSEDLEECRLDVTYDGHALVHLGLERHGDADEVRVRAVLTPAAGLDLLVLDAAGAPVPDLGVEVDAAAGEIDGASGSALSGDLPLRTTTGPDGLARFDGVPTRVHLVVVADEREFLSVDSATGTLRPEGGGDRPLSVHRGARRELRVVLPGWTELHGRVRTPEGTPVHASITVNGLGPTSLGVERFVDSLGTDERGEFTARVPNDAGRVGLVAVPRWDGRSTTGSVAPEADPASAAVGIVALPHDPADRVELVVAPSAELEGEVLDADGPVEGALVFLTPADASPLSPMGPFLLQTTLSDAGGAFRFTGLLPGEYRLVASAPGGFPTAEEVATTGGDPVRLRLEDAQVAELRFALDPAREGVSGEIAVYRQLGEDGAWGPAPVLGAEGALSVPLGLPPEWSFDDWGTHRARFEGSTFVESRSVRLPDPGQPLRLAPGTYWLCVFRRHDSGIDFPMGTGRVRIEAGHHLVRGELQPVGSLYGRVLDLPEASHVRLVDERGRPAPAAYDGRDLRLNVLPLSAAGRFRLVAPAGRYELQVGTEATLAQDRPARRLSVEIEPGGETEVTVPATDR